MNKITKFLREAYSELKKATWLGRKEVIANTIIVFVFCALVALYISAIDFSLVHLINALLNRGA